MNNTFDNQVVDRQSVAVLQQQLNDQEFELNKRIDRQHLNYLFDKYSASDTSIPFSERLVGVVSEIETRADTPSDRILVGIILAGLINEDKVEAGRVLATGLFDNQINGFLKDLDSEKSFVAPLLRDSLKDSVFKL